MKIQRLLVVKHYNLLTEVVQKMFKYTQTWANHHGIIQETVMPNQILLKRFLEWIAIPESHPQYDHPTIQMGGNGLPRNGNDCASLFWLMSWTPIPDHQSGKVALPTVTYALQFYYDGQDLFANLGVSYDHEWKTVELTLQETKRLLTWLDTHALTFANLNHSLSQQSTCYNPDPLPTLPQSIGEVFDWWKPGEFKIQIQHQDLLSAVVVRTSDGVDTTTDINDSEEFIAYTAYTFQAFLTLLSETNCSELI